MVITTVSEYGGSPIAGVRVQVDDEEWATTDQRGEAGFVGIEPPYSVRLFQALETESMRFQDVWELVDQTETRLEIPVDGSRVTTHEGDITGSISGTTGGESQIAVFGGKFPDTGAVSLAEEDGTFQLAGFRWEGPASRSFDLHALESDTADPPTHYIGFGNASITLRDSGEGATAEASIELAPVGESHVTGSVAVADGLAPALRPSLRLELADGAAVDLGSGDAALTPGDFELTAPDIDGATMRLAFRGGDLTGGPPAGPSAYVSLALTLPADDVAIDLPAAVELVEPADGASIDGATVFRWDELAGGTRYGLHLSCEWDGGNVNYRLIETTGTEVSLPDIPELDVGAGATCFWRVGWFEGEATGYESVTLPAELRSSWSAERSASF
ncbi:MAG TPA: hypothetical protein VK698_38250 [Kofleriaceae bacterium]|nr:hypothetical protein [Kofleriaceae bacterium]